MRSNDWKFRCMDTQPIDGPLIEGRRTASVRDARGDGSCEGRTEIRPPRTDLMCSDRGETEGHEWGSAESLVPYIVTILIIRADTTRRTKSESPIFFVRDVNGFLHSYSGSRVQLKSKTSVTFKHKVPLHFTQFQKYPKQSCFRQWVIRRRRWKHKRGG